MRVARQIWLDRVIAKPIAWCLNVTARILGFFLRIDHSLDRKFKTIAVCKYKGLGSIVQATPLLQTLRKNYPETRIIFITSESNRALVKRLPMVDEVRTVSDENFFRLLTSSIRLFTSLWRKVDVYLDLERYSSYSAIMTTMSLARNRFGYYQRTENYRLGVYTHMMFFNTRAPISEVYLQFARLLNCKEIVQDLYPVRSGNTEIIGEMPNAPYIIMNPNASDLRLERRWGKTNFANVASAFITHYPDHSVVFIGSPSEAAYTQAVVDLIPTEQQHRVVNTAGKTSLDGLLQLLEQAKLVVSNDTGPMHLAFSLKKPVVALFGPCHPQQYGQAEFCFPLYKNLYCSPCVHEFAIPPCKGNNQCMQLIETAEVLQQIQHGLGDEVQTQAKQAQMRFKANNVQALGEVRR